MTPGIRLIGTYSELLGFFTQLPPFRRLLHPRVVPLIAATYGQANNCPAGSAETGSRGASSW